MCMCIGSNCTNLSTGFAFVLKLAADHVHLLLVLGKSRQVLEHIVAVLQVALHIMGQPRRRRS